MLRKLKETKLYKQFIAWRDERISYNIHMREYIPKLKALKNIHKGKRCFIIGNGPSLRTEDLEQLKDEYTFASNYIFKIFDKTSWRPTYYCNSDLGVLQRMKDEPGFWNTGANINFFQSNARYIMEDNFPENTALYYLVRTDGERKISFSSAIEKKIFDSMTITYIMLQIACYMGFSEIYLLGIDHNYSLSVDRKGSVAEQKVKDHFYSMKTGKEDDGGAKAHIETMELGYWVARDYAQKHHISINNATRGGKLEIFERVDFDKLF